VCFFGSEIKARYTLCVRYTLCDGGPSLGVKSGLFDDFDQYFFLRTPSGNGNVDRGLRDLLESGFKSAKICHRRKKSPAKFRKKILITFLGYDIFYF
jgi:hypothetical protein